MSEKSKSPRRNFIAGLGVVAAGGVAAKLAPESITSAISNVLPAQDPDGDSYRLTEHVKKYYRTTTI
ncbi:hypothetical protein [Herminiimonas arsenitoxidans]|uniref:hypothetical protein n=1 Tax=Herminiimonas arsenitoxidans TaxID=1809410 RepID=UPI000970CC85|nr:hypothetical protein [Herminiimonas arsenitoxidans]